jgi:hypothetical protein
MELGRDGVFEHEEELSAALVSARGPVAMGRAKQQRVDWKGRYGYFRSKAATFASPFNCAEIDGVPTPDEVAYCRSRLRTDLLKDSPSRGFYFEIEVICNPDNLSLAVVDSEDPAAQAAGGRSSVTFSPDIGAVIRECKTRETPHHVEGAYIQPLSTTPPNSRFEGFMGLYLCGGHLAFFRRCREPAPQLEATPREAPPGEERPLGPWETTGFVTDLSWVEGRRLTPCLAFRDDGAYRVRLVQIASEPPIEVKRTASAYEPSAWTGLDWEAGQAVDE